MVPDGSVEIVTLFCWSYEALATTALSPRAPARQGSLSFHSYKKSLQAFDSAHSWSLNTDDPLIVHGNNGDHSIEKEDIVEDTAANENLQVFLKGPLTVFNFVRLFGIEDIPTLDMESM